MNINAKFHQSRTKGKYSKIIGTERLEEEMKRGEEFNFQVGFGVKKKNV